MRFKHDSLPTSRSKASGIRLFSGSSDEKKVDIVDEASPSENKTADKTESPVEEDNSKRMESLNKSESLANELHRNLLFKYAEAENKRRERLDEIKRRDAKYIKSFAEKTLSIYESLDKVCTLAESKAKVDGANEKVKSFTEGLVMTRCIMRNILAKHNVVASK